MRGLICMVALAGCYGSAGGSGAANVRNILCTAEDVMHDDACTSTLISCESEGVLGYTIRECSETETTGLIEFVPGPDTNKDKEASR